MTTKKEPKEAVIKPEVLVLERLMGMTRIMRKGNDPKLAEAAAKFEQEFAEKLERLAA